jgi:hypothetical protein
MTEVINYILVIIVPTVVWVAPLALLGVLGCAVMPPKAPTPAMTDAKAVVAGARGSKALKDGSPEMAGSLFSGMIEPRNYYFILLLIINFTADS